MPREFAFAKEERLRHKRLVDALFAHGEGIYDFPLRLVWRRLDAGELKAEFKNSDPEGIDVMQMMVTVPKKRRKRAVDRVLLRRRIREAYRLNRLALKRKMQFCYPGGTLSMGFIYIGNDNADYAVIEKKMRKLLGKLEKSISPHS